eukprot:Tamp_09919.p1 GENE.Tamp_09919~~Tamp_09919.p1  ORF type:complete len:439 (+),score=40.68 Tamp_09919:95-1318(+)
MPESAVPCRAGARAARDFAKSPVVVRGARQTHAWAATAPSQGARARTGLIAVRWCVPAPSGSVMAKRAPFPCAALGLVLLAASVEGILDAAPHSALRPGLRRREPVAMGLASVPSPPVPREPLGFIAGFDFDAFGKGLKDFALGGISGGIAQTIVFPIDLAKTRIQDEVVAAGAKAQYSGVFQTILKVAKDEGVLKLWRGVTPVLIGSTPECALEIGGNSVARQMLADKLKQPLDQLPFWAEFAAGGVGGFCQVIATCPMERVKILQQVLGDKGGSVSTIVSQVFAPSLFLLATRFLNAPLPCPYVSLESSLSLVSLTRTRHSASSPSALHRARQWGWGGRLGWAGCTKASRHATFATSRSPPSTSVSIMSRGNLSVTRRSRTPRPKTPRSKPTSSLRPVNWGRWTI